MKNDRHKLQVKIVNYHSSNNEEKDTSLNHALSQIANQLLVDAEGLTTKSVRDLINTALLPYHEGLTSWNIVDIISKNSAYYKNNPDKIKRLTDNVRNALVKGKDIRYSQIKVTDKSKFRYILTDKTRKDHIEKIKQLYINSVSDNRQMLDIFSSKNNSDQLQTVEQYIMPSSSRLIDQCTEQNQSSSASNFKPSQLKNNSYPQSSADVCLSAFVEACKSSLDLHSIHHCPLAHSNILDCIFYNENITILPCTESPDDSKVEPGHSLMDPLDSNSGSKYDGSGFTETYDVSGSNLFGSYSYPTPSSTITTTTQYTPNSLTNDHESPFYPTPGMTKISSYNTPVSCWGTPYPNSDFLGQMPHSSQTMPYPESTTEYSLNFQEEWDGSMQGLGYYDPPVVMSSISSSHINVAAQFSLEGNQIDPDFLGRFHEELEES